MNQTKKAAEGMSRLLVSDKIGHFTLSISVLLFSLSVESFSLGPLTQEEGVFANVPVMFWVGLSIAVYSVIRAKCPHVLVFGCVVLLMYTIGSICIMEPFGRMHDSALNLADSIRFVDGDHSVSYADSFPGSFIVFGTLARISDLTFWQLPRIFPFIAMVIYVPTFLALLRRFSRLTNQNWSGPSSNLAVLFVVCLSSALAIRNNIAPQTIGFLLFLMSFTLLLFPRKPRELTVFVIIVISMIISHPLTPLLAFPIYLAAVLGIARSREEILDLGRKVVIVLVLFIAWIILVAKGIVNAAVVLLLELGEREVSVPSLTSYPPDAEFFVTVNWVFYAVLGLVLLLSLISILKTGARLFLLVWLISFITLFVATVGFRFFDRVLLFGIPAAAILFLQFPRIWSFRIGLRRSSAGGREKRNSALAGRSLAVLTVVLVVLCVYRSYYFDNAVDRITESEVEAQRFLAEVPHGYSIYLGGFVLPFDFSANVTGSYRGQFTVEQLYDADFILISEQVIAAIVMVEGTEAIGTPSWNILESRIHDSSRIYDSDYASIWL